MRRLMTAAVPALSILLGIGFLQQSFVNSQTTPGGSSPAHTAYLGLDRNIYPGDEALPVLRKTFAFSSYWIGPPPGEKATTWTGKRSLLQSMGFGFAVLFNGRATRELRTAAAGKQKGAADAARAARLARQEGFQRGTVIFLDIEEGGRLPVAYHNYVQAWCDGLARAGYRCGVYCSAIPVDEGGGARITTAQDIQAHAGTRRVVYWVYNDACPPSPGCAFAETSWAAGRSGFAAASVWQYAQSPRRKEFTASCPANYGADGNCYAPGDTAHRWFLDANVASSPNPSGPEGTTER